MLVYRLVCMFLCYPSVRSSLTYQSLQQIADNVNRRNTTWKATGKVFKASIDSGFIQNLLGAHLDYNDSNLLSFSSFNDFTARIPDYFDARYQWPDCPTIREIRDQGRCGNCWAVAGVATMSDRHCIHLGQIVRLSATDLTTCSTGKYLRGCNGGTLVDAYLYWVNKGIATGGPYGSRLGCQPYVFPPVHSHYSGPRPKTPECVRRCQHGYWNSYSESKHYGRVAYRVPAKEIAIQREIMTNGPVEAGFLVYEDFVTYESGVYTHHYGKRLGGHAVKIIGWGTEENTPYWLAANSWGGDWALNGYFKISRGQNECEIESKIVSGLPEK